MGFLELRQEPGLYSRVTAGMSFRNSSLFIDGPGAEGPGALAAPAAPASRALIRQTSATWRSSLPWAPFPPALQGENQPSSKRWLC